MEQWREELYHHGIKGMKWGVRRYQNPDGSRTPEGKKRYRSTSFSAKIARKQNEKIDKGFKKWDENSQKKSNAIELGKKANQARMDYERDSGNKELRIQYKKANKDYKKALNDNTTWRKGDIKKEVGSDISRKYLSEAKKVQKQLEKDPNNKQLKKQYNDLMSKHDIERAKARRAPQVAQNRSRKIASVKRGATMTVKTAAVGAAATAGTVVVNQYLRNNGMKTINSDSIMRAAKTVKKILRYV